MELLELEFSREIHPVDVIEQVAHNNDWSFELSLIHISEPTRPY